MRYRVSRLHTFVFLITSGFFLSLLSVCGCTHLGCVTCVERVLQGPELDTTTTTTQGSDR